MNIIFKGTKLGSEIWEIIQHELLNEDDWIKDKEYEFIQYDKKTKDGVIYSESKPIQTEQEQLISEYSQEKAKAIKEIRDFQTLGMTAEAEARQAEWLEYHNENNPY